MLFNIYTAAVSIMFLLIGGFFGHYIMPKKLPKLPVIITYVAFIIFMMAVALLAGLKLEDILIQN